MKYISALLAFFGLSTADTDVLVGKVNGALASLKDHVEEMKAKAVAHEESLMKLAQTHDEQLVKLENAFHRRTDALFKKQDADVAKVEEKGAKISNAIDKGENYLKAFFVEETPAPVTVADPTLIKGDVTITTSGNLTISVPSVTVKGE